MNDELPILRILNDMEKRAENIHSEAVEMDNMVAAEEAHQILVQIEQVERWVQSERQLYE